jgi:hypothetical protein
LRQLQLRRHHARDPRRWRSEPGRLGGNQTRRIRFDGDRLVLMPPPRTWRGVMQHPEMFFERIG